MFVYLHLVLMADQFSDDTSERVFHVCMLGKGGQGKAGHGPLCPHDMILFAFQFYTQSFDVLFLIISRDSFSDGLPLQPED